MPCKKIDRKGLWGVVLAAGEGKRMDSFIRSVYGISSPKQYVAFTGEHSLLQQTLHRIAPLIPVERTRIVVDPKHIREIRSQLSHLPEETLLFQPHNRETAPGALLPLIHIARLDPEARVAFFPADHFIHEEERFMRYVGMADEVIHHHPDQIVLLGIRPDGPEVEYGWIAPGEPIDEINGIKGVRRVARFLEKPAREVAADFFQRGYLWNTFVSVMRASTLIDLARRHLPHIWKRFERMKGLIGTDLSGVTMAREYEAMAPATLSHGIFERSPDRIVVLEVEGVYWSDWGNGHRVLHTLRQLGKASRWEKERAVHLEAWEKSRPA
ncbi:MAG: sugar phosphate nucleotidyltransferase [Candidatus Manganitrophaceae bacterium]